MDSGNNIMIFPGEEGREGGCSMAMVCAVVLQKCKVLLLSRVESVEGNFIR